MNAWIETFDILDDGVKKYLYNKYEMKKWLEINFSLPKYPPEIEELFKHVRERYPMRCPETGSFIGWKKTFMKDEQGHIFDVIIELQIPKEAKRSNSGFSYKCRCDKAVVKSIENIETGKNYQEAPSSYDPNFIYKVGETVEVDWFDENPFSDCSCGIHFFMTQEEAKEYMLLIPHHLYEKQKEVYNGK